jgi:hypothetical protein
MTIRYENHLKEHSAELAVIQEAQEDMIDLMSEVDDGGMLRSLMDEMLDLESEEYAILNPWEHDDSWPLEDEEEEALPRVVSALLPNLLTALRGKLPGVYNASTIVKEAGGSANTAGMLTKLLKANPAHSIARELDRIGATYVKCSEGWLPPGPLSVREAARVGLTGDSYD